MHRNNFRDDTSHPVLEVVRRWAVVVDTVGADVERNPNPKTWLAFDSLYMGAEGRDLLKTMKRPFSASVNPQCFGPEVKLLHTNHVDVSGSFRTIYNETTGETMTFHHDTRKGIGKKYNMSFGLERSEDKVKVRQHAHYIVGYDVYESFFDTCDRFNRNLHDKSSPHRRGGHGVLGENGRAHDFLMACILQNTFALHSELGGAYKENQSFKEKCNCLAEQLIEYSGMLVPL